MSNKAAPRRTRVGKYELGRTVGEGTFAKVKFARNVETGSSVAIKILDRDQVLKNKMVEQVCCFLISPTCRVQHRRVMFLVLDSRVFFFSGKNGSCSWR